MLVKKVRIFVDGELVAEKYLTEKDIVKSFLLPTRIEQGVWIYEFITENSG